MAEYVYIRNYNQRGTLAISRIVFDQIVSIVTSKIRGVSVKKQNNKVMFSFHRPIKCEIKNGKVTTFIEILVAPDVNVTEVCSKIQEEVMQAISSMTELVPFTPNIKVMGIDDKLA